MACTSCGRVNPGGARFCGGCGAALVRHCPACGTDAASDARFCVACGAALGARPAEASVARKMVTVAFADLIGSVSLHERLDAESVRRLMDRYHRTMAAAVERHGGRVVQLLGDGVLAAFGVPRVAEDDAVRAVRAGVEMQTAYRALVRELGAPLADVGLRVAVNTGEVVVGDDETAVIGDPTNVAARLQHEARDGDVIVGESTQLLVAEHVTLAPLGTFALRGRAEAVDAYRVVSLARPASARATPFVGRDAELRRLWSAFDDAVAAPGARLAVLLASPGLGKSRLLGELQRRAGQRATVLSARCDAAGGATFAPIAGALRAHLRLADGAPADAVRGALAALPAADDAERARITAGVGALVAGTPAAPEETFFAVRRLLAALAAARPVVLAIDDVHWAEPLLLDLVEHLVQWSAGVRLLIVVAARPELRDLRPSLTVPGGTVSELMTLGALDAGAATRLAAGIAGGAELPAALVGRVLAASEGHPLFLAELVRMLVQDGTLRRDGDRWVTTVEVAKLDMPPTIQVLLAARIERLAPDERAVLERAAVIGRQFSRGAVAHLLPDVEDLDARIAALERSELIEPDAARHLGEPALRFHHALIRDAAYRRVLKETRAELHERLADWIAARGGDGTEHEETLGWHLEQAHQNLRELGPLDARGHGLGERAARHLGAAGSRALAREDLALAASLLGRAIDALEPEHPLRAELAPDWCEALLAAGEVGAAARAIDELERSAGESARLRAWHACFAAQLATLTDPQSLRPTAARVAAAADVLAAAADPAGEAKAHAVHAGVLSRLGAIGQSEAALDKALAAARRARDRRRANAVLAGAPVAALWGPSPVTRASGRCLDVVRVLRITHGAPAVEAVALRCQAVLETLRGRGEAARRMIASSRRMVEELGIAQQVLDADVFAGIVELLEGDAAAAQSFLRTAYDGLRARGLGIDAARAAALLGRALLVLGRVPEAEDLSRDSESLAGDDLKAAIAWRGVRAEALARRGEVDAALALARAAVEIAAGTDALLDHADARVALATALRAAGRDAEAEDEQRRAVELWEAKGAAVLVARVGRPRGAAADADLPTSPPERERPPNDVVRATQAMHALRAVVPNAASEELVRLDRLVAGRDLDGVAQAFADLVETVHRPLGITWDRAGAMASFRMLLDSGEFVYRHEPLATLGDLLALSRQTIASQGMRREDFDIGALENDYLWLSEVNEHGRRVRSESFAGDQPGIAVARLYERHAELLAGTVDGPRAATVAAAVAAVVAMRPEAIEPSLAPDVRFTDHRTLGLGRSRGAERYLRGLRSLAETTHGARNEDRDVLVASERVLVLQRSTTGVDRASGGAFELHVVMLWAFGEDGRICDVELFDAAQAGAALARGRVLDAGPGSRVARATPATALASAADRASRFVPETGANDAPWLEGDDRHHPAVQAAMRRFADALSRRDWDALAASLTPDLIVADHRRLGWEPLHGRAAYLTALQGLFELAPDTRMRLDHVETFANGFLVCAVWTGTRDGGAFEEPSLIVGEVGRDGRMRRFDAYDVEQLDAARSRLAAVAAGDAPDPLARWLRPNAAIAAHDRFAAAIAAGDPDGMRAAFSADGVVDDRRALFRGVIDADSAVAAMGRAAVSADARGLHIVGRLIAVFGERVALQHQLWTGGPEAAPYEVELLAVIEADHDGRMVRVTSFDCDDRRAAFREANERWAAVEPEIAPLIDLSTAYFEATAARDVARVRALLADDVVVHSRRRTGTGLLEGADAYLQSLTAIWDLTRDSQAESLACLAVGARAAVLVTRVAGTLHDGGPFETLGCTLVTVDDGRFTRFEQFELEDADRALARFAEIAAGERADAADPLRIPENLASRVRARSRMLAQARDADALRALCAPDFRFEDRRRLVRTAGDRETFVVDAHHIPAATWRRAVHALLATSGDRLCLHHARFTGPPEGGFEIEALDVTEVDAEGRLLAIVLFDADDPSAAEDELRQRAAAVSG